MKSCVRWNSFHRMDGWMDDLRFYVLFNSISVISGRWLAVNERLCAMELCTKDIMTTVTTLNIAILDVLSIGINTSLI